jgi:hypothetical protein
MNAMSQRDLQQHVTIVGWHSVIGHAIFLLIGAFVFLLLIGLALVTREPEPMWVAAVARKIVAPASGSDWW